MANKRIEKKHEKKQNESFILMMPAGGDYRLEVLNMAGCDLKKGARRKLSFLKKHYGSIADMSVALSESKQRGRRPALLISDVSRNRDIWMLIPERGFGSRETAKQFSSRWHKFALRLKPYCNDENCFAYCLR